MSAKLTPDGRAGIVYRRAQDMLIGARLRALRRQRNLSQGEISNRIGLLRFYVSRVENNHTLSSVDTLEKIARALDVPIYVPSTTGKIRRRELRKWRATRAREIQVRTQLRCVSSVDCYLG